ncbi:kinase-like domain-containing protein [Mariannaea sp. PMI_226]|nr:kinase-like domain-containing protein [Mariannaea sp. PMI_226]
MKREIPYVQYVFDTSDTEGSVLQLAPFLFPGNNFTDGTIRVSKLCQGTTNALFKVSRQPAGPHCQDIAVKVLVKVYGEGTEITIDREKELQLHKILSDNQLAPDLLVRFSNGHGYAFLDGTACSVEEIAEKRIWCGVARELANWHAVLPVVNVKLPGDVVDFEPSIWSTAKKWLDALPSNTEKQRAKKKLLHGEFQYLKKTLLGNDPRQSLVFGHGDLLCGNIIMQSLSVNDRPEKAASVKFIDYEHSTYCPPAFELANHFAEWAGFDCNYNLLPTTSTRVEFIREYLQAHRDITKERHGTDGPTPPSSRVTQAEVDQVMADVDSFRGFPGFYWGLCALIQAQASTGSIDFDYAGYAEKRLQEYWAWRGAVSGANEAVSLREERWTAP